jgi:hypothetical protein
LGSPRHLNLRLIFTGKKPAKATLDVWPALPFYIQFDGDNLYDYDDDDVGFDGRVDNIIAVLEHDRDRVHLIDIRMPFMKDLSAAMEVPFPELTSLVLRGRLWVTVGALPDSFLGRSAPRLQTLELYDVQFPGLPILLLSCADLVTLTLWGIPHSGYISPEALAAALSTLTRLEELSLEFMSSPGRHHPPPLRRSVLPVLTRLALKGFSEDLEDLVARFDAPQLNFLAITFVDQIEFDAPQSIQFIGRTPKSKTIEGALVNFEGGGARVVFSSISSRIHEYGVLNVNILSKKLDRQISSLARVCTSSLPPFSTLEDLYIDRFENVYWRDNGDNVRVSWLELLRPFGAVKNLYLSEQYARIIVPALQELVGNRTTEVLPTLQNIFVEGLQPSGRIQYGIRQFVAARQVTGRPIAVSCWVRPRGWRDFNLRHQPLLDLTPPLPLP